METKKSFKNFKKIIIPIKKKDIQNQDIQNNNIEDYEPMPNILRYSKDFEILLKHEAEKSESMSILHHMAYKSFNRLSMLTNIPVIILSGLIGFLSPIDLFAQQNIFLGSLSVFCGIIKTLDNYMDFTKRSQTHYMTSLNYKKISRFLQIQLSLEKDCRVNPNDILKYITTDLENISNSEPCIPDKVIRLFNLRYKNDKDKTAKPPICNGLTIININDAEHEEINSIDISLDIEEKPK